MIIHYARGLGKGFEEENCEFFVNHFYAQIHKLFGLNSVKMHNEILISQGLKQAQQLLKGGFAPVFSLIFVRSPKKSEINAAFARKQCLHFARLSAGRAYTQAHLFERSIFQASCQL